MIVENHKEYLCAFSDFSDGDLSFYLHEEEENKKNWNNLQIVKDQNLNFPAFAHQIHEDGIFIVETEQPTSPVSESDALITHLNNTPIGVFSADCLPVLICSPLAVAAVHAGWKSTRINISGKTVKKMIERFGTKPEEVKVFIGPSIGTCCLEMGEEIKPSFIEADPESEAFFEKRQKWHLDLKGLNQFQITREGIPKENIKIFDECTFCQEKKFFSYRRQKQRNGSMFSFVVKKC